MRPVPGHSAAYWITGALVGFLGVAVARLVAPHFAGPVCVELTAAGQLVGVAGLFIIALGVRRRLASARGAAATDDVRAGKPS